MKKLKAILFGIILLFFSAGLSAQKSDQPEDTLDNSSEKSEEESVVTGRVDTGRLYYRREISVHTGLQFMSDTSAWSQSRARTLNEDLLLKQSGTTYSAVSKEFSPQSASGMSPFIAIEAIWGIYPGKLPYLEDIEGFTLFRGFRTGGGVQIHPLYTQQTFSASDTINYTNTSGTVSRDYRADITVDEEMLSVIPYISMYYFYEKGIEVEDMNLKGLLPYAGFELGLSISSVKRKFILEGQAAGYKIEGQVQENHINSMALMFRPVIGLQYHLSGPHFIDLRLGYRLGAHNLSLARQGTFTETATGSSAITYSQAVSDNERSVPYNTGGFSVTLGYTLGI